MSITFSISEPFTLSQDDLEKVVRLINEVYWQTEADLFEELVPRTTVRELKKIIQAEQFIIAQSGNRIIGACYLKERSPGTFEFGMLATDPKDQGRGVGSGLIAFAEKTARLRGGSEMLADVLYPADDSSHPYKDFLIGWYRRLGYKLFSEVPFDVKYAKVIGKMAKPCKLIIMKKTLSSNS